MYSDLYSRLRCSVTAWAADTYVRSNGLFRRFDVKSTLVDEACKLQRFMCFESRFA